MSDCSLIFDYLATHPGWNNIIDIELSLKPNARNWAARSRISDMNRFWLKKNKLNFFVDSRLGKNGCADYMLVIDESHLTFDPSGQGTFLKVG